MAKIRYNVCFVRFFGDFMNAVLLAVIIMVGAVIGSGACGAKFNRGGGDWWFIGRVAFG